jgi:hypothetical protein
MSQPSKLTPFFGALRQAAKALDAAPNGQITAASIGGSFTGGSKYEALTLGRMVPRSKWIMLGDGPSLMFLDVFGQATIRCSAYHFSRNTLIKTAE